MDWSKGLDCLPNGGEFPRYFYILFSIHYFHYLCKE